MSSSPEPPALSPPASEREMPTPPSANLNGTDDPEDTNPTAAGDDDDDKMSNSSLDSDLSDVDEAQFEDFDPANVAIEDRPAIAIDESNVSLLKASKRKRPGVNGGDVSKKKEKKREKTKKNRKDAKPQERPGSDFDDDDDDNFSGGETLEGKRTRRSKSTTNSSRPKKVSSRPNRQRTPENEDHLSPEERRRRALDRAMDAALVNPSRQKRRMDGEDLSDNADQIIDQMRQRMNHAAEADNESRKSGQAAHQKLKLLPEVVSLLNRHSLQNAILDPEANIMESVRFFLEPLSDGSLPAYNIQRDLFQVLAKLPMTHETLVASGLGKVTLFYTKSKRPEVSIKRLAEKMLGDWSRPIMKRSDDYRKRRMVVAEYDPSQKSQPQPSQASPRRTPAQQRDAMLALPVRNPNRAQMQHGKSSYPIVPVSNFVPPTAGSSGSDRHGSGGAGGLPARPVGAIGDEKFRRMKMGALNGAKGVGGS